MRVPGPDWLVLQKVLDRCSCLCRPWAADSLGYDTVGLYFSSGRTVGCHVGMIFFMRELGLQFSLALFGDLWALFDSS